MNCPECNSENLYKKGFRNGKQRYQCKDCGRYFVEGTKFVGRAVKLPTLVKTCLYCGSTHINRRGRLDDGTSRYECMDCRRSFSSKTKILPPIEYPCPYCGGKLKRAGTGKLGQPKYLCTECNKNCSGEPPKANPKFKDINTEIDCPYCGSMDIKLGGTATRKPITRYLCNTCGRAFTEETKQRLEEYRQSLRYNEVCPRCGSHRIIVAGVTKVGNNRFRCLECKRTYTKGATILELSEKTKSTILMYRVNLNVPVADIAKYFKCSEYMVRKLEKEYREKLKDVRVCKTVRGRSK